MPLETFFTPSEESMLFLCSCLMGAALGVVYDIFRAVRILTRRTGGGAAASVIIEDILFFMLYAVAMLIFVIRLGRGQFRFYFMAGNALGFLIYLATLGAAVVRLFRAVGAALSAVFSLILRPLMAIFKPIGQKVRALFVKINISFKNRLKTLEKQ